MKYDIIVLGSGPGGYVTAIRASQLGFKVAVIEKENLGGICLNWGCIPTKALLKSAQVFDYLKHASDYGLSVKEFDKDFNAVIKRSRDVAEGMSKGVQFLMKKNKITLLLIAVLTVLAVVLLIFNSRKSSRIIINNYPISINSSTNTVKKHQRSIIIH